ncbi:phage terminase small subunit [Peribacillus asahii]|uniref:phage terminase small subunit n=1 Tax=Peribacillus asahii TaxID=228899 RepID=UPI0037F6BEDC
MARPRNPKRDEAFRIWINSNGTKKLKEIAAELDLSDSQIRKWKNQDKWDDHLNSNVTKSKGNVTKQKRGAPKGSRNAKGHGAPKQNQNAVTHGFFSKFLPPETLEIIESMNERSPADLIWDQIQIQYAAIIRAQSIMFVQDQHDMTKELKKHKVSDLAEEQEWEIQYAWDKHATFLNAQSRAMGEFRSSIRQFVEMADAEDERRLKLSIMQQQLKKLERENTSENSTEDKLSKLFDAIEGEFRGD